MKIIPARLDDAEALKQKITQDSPRKRSQSSTGDSSGTAESSVQISALARELGAFDVSNEDKVRSDKVAEFKAKIESGTYKVDSEAVARKLIEELAF